MSTTIIRDIHFESSHHLPKTPEGHKCRRLHGHSYTIEIHVTGEVDPEFGWIMDFGDIKEAFSPLYTQLDHHILNDIEGLENPTSENIAAWIWERLLPAIPDLSTIVVHETYNSRCIYTGPQKK
ncbi:6-carboxytetrahydropterin synthase QueD [Myxococcota bacterium]|nr:6-carboxytetrahydropterin synthase QueD [Myxococcota bacterium]